MKKIILLLSAIAITALYAPVCNAQSDTIITLAGNGTANYNGDNILATKAELNLPFNVAVDAEGNIYIADKQNQRIRKINTAGIITTIAGNGTEGFSGENVPATAAELNDPFDVAVDKSGNVYIVDGLNQVIRRINTSGIINTIAGTLYSPGDGGDGGPATAATFSYPDGIAIDDTGNLYISDNANNAIRKINTSGIIHTIAGGGSGGLGDGGPATAATLNGPQSVAVDKSGNVYIADFINQRVRKVGTNGIISTFAGGGSSYTEGDSAKLVALDNPTSVATDGSGNVYIAVGGDDVIRKVSTSGIITTFAGKDTMKGYSGDGGPATLAKLYYPNGIRTDNNGNVYIADEQNNRVRKITVPAPVSSYVSNISPALDCELYPNPVSDILTIKSESGKFNSFIVTNTLGEVLIQQPLTNGQTGVNVKALPTGVYNITLKGDDAVTVKKFVKE